MLSNNQDDHKLSECTEFESIERSFLGFKDDNLNLKIMLEELPEDAKTGYYFYPIGDQESIRTRSVEKILGLKQKESQLSLRSIFQFISPDYRSEFKKCIRRLFKEKKFQQLELKLNALNGDKWVRLEMKVFDEYLTAIIYDQTAQKEFESNLLEINKELEYILYKSSHNLKGPAASISGLVSIALSEVKDENSLRYLQMIHQSTERLNLVLNDLLNVNKIKLGNLDISPINFEEIIRDVSENLKFVSGIKDIKINSEFHFSSFSSDKTLIYSIFQNLIENAIKYKKPNSNSYLNIEVKDDQNGIRILFADNGIGVPKDASEKIFDMFFRANDTQQGSGLGLYIVKNAVNKLNGTINLDSEVGKGTIFDIFLPAN